MIASSWMDPVLGVDMHWEMVPTPAPVPMPFPHPFIGIVLDLSGLAGAVAMNAVMSAVFGAPFRGPVLNWFLPATNTGTNARHVPGHFIIPPGTIWAPVPRTPKPKIRPNEVVVPAPPIMPENDAISILGSMTVHVSGSNAVRLGDLLLSCSEPVRLPSSVVLAIPKGAPILIGGPPALDLMAAITASLRTRFMSDSLHALVSRLAPGRLRNLLNRVVCFFTGHPVDVASGKVMTWAVEAELPGPLPLRIERVYSSAFADRDGPLGHGWSLSLDQAIWTERGKVVLLEEDGREIEFDTFDLPEHRMRVGEEVRSPIERLTLRCLPHGCWQVVGAGGVTRHFTPVPGRDPGRAMLRRIRARAGAHEIAFEYDGRGALRSVRDAGGRVVGIERDEAGRVSALRLPHPQLEGTYVHRKYVYDQRGDLVEVTDALGASWRMEYAGHLLVREADRTGLSFYFEYDGLGQDAWCTRTWGDGGIYDHRISYDKVKKVTFVTDSLGHTTKYRMNLAGQVVERIDPLSGRTGFAYDPRSLRKTREEDPLGHATEWLHDELGRTREVVDAAGGRFTVQHGRHGVERAVDPTGAEWRWSWGRDSLLARETTPAGEATEFEHVNGLLTRVRRSRGLALVARYDDHLNMVAQAAEGGVETRYQYDRLGRLEVIENPCGGRAQIERDLEGRTVKVATATGITEELAWGPEGDLRHVRDATRLIRYRFGPRHKVVEREEAGALQRLEYDTEGRVAAVLNEAGERHRLVRDPVGRVVSEVGFDGVVMKYRCDAAGRVVEIAWPSGRRARFQHDPLGRVVRIERSDGDVVELAWGGAGGLVSAQNAWATVEIVRDASNRPVEEILHQGEHRFSVRSRYGSDGLRSGLSSSLGASVGWVRGAFGDVTEVYIHSSAASRPVLALEGSSPTLQVERDPLGRTQAERWDTGLSVEWTRDRAGRPIGRRTALRGGAELDALEVRWRGQAQIAGAVRRGRGEFGWKYDARGRLIEMTGPDGREVRALDPVGNVYRSEAAGDWVYGPGGAVQKAGEAVLERDADGQVVAQHDAAGTRRYGWNGAGLLERVTLPDGRTLLFEYDAFARRTKKTVQRIGDAVEVEGVVRYVWDGDRLLHEVPEHGEPVHWCWDEDGLRPVAKEVGGRRWAIVSDTLGVPTEMYDDRSVLAWKGELSVTGRARILVGRPEECPWRYPGHYHDAETGLHYNRYRYYDPALGAYLSPDPLGLVGGLHPFAYVDDPLSQVDPFGLHVVQAFLDGQPVLNPETGENWWENIENSGKNGMAPSGYGRLGDSENLVMDHLAATEGKEGLKGKVLEIVSLGQPQEAKKKLPEFLKKPLNPCRGYCTPGLDQFAKDMEMEDVVYRYGEKEEHYPRETCT